MKILVTGGCGYIGSHICLELIKGGYEVIALDNCMNSDTSSIDAINNISGSRIKLYNCDVNDYSALAEIFKNERIDGVIHLAMKKKYRTVSNSLDFDYYIDNVSGILGLIKVMSEYEVFNLIFASSAAVYGVTKESPVTEAFPLDGNSDYATVKIMQEMILNDLVRSDKRFSVTVLRYFNPIGADESGLLGENINNTAPNIIPHIINVISGKRAELLVYGGYKSTKDSSGVRDYIHVSDVAKAHINVIERKFNKSGIYKYNIGCGVGHSVIELINEFEKISGKKIPYRIVSPKAVEAEISCADITRAKNELGFEPKCSLKLMCETEFNRYKKWGRGN